jgi:hypothetical protein
MPAKHLKLREQQLFDQANRRWGLLRTQDLARAGVDRNGIAHRVALHRLTRIHQGVYAFGHTVLPPEAYWLAALWTLGRDVALSHLTAAAFHGWLTQPPGDDVHVSTTRALDDRDGIVVHRTRHLDRVDVFRPHPLLVTHPPRTLVDLADVMDWGDYRALADRVPKLEIPAIRAAQARVPGRDGARLVTRLIEADDTHTKSEFERRFLRFSTRHGLPRPDGLNERVAEHQADCVYRTAPPLVIELDGRAYHQRRAEMRADRQRDSDYQLAGFRILRLVWDDLHDAEAPATVRRIRGMLGLPAEA